MYEYAVVILGFRCSSRLEMLQTSRTVSHQLLSMRCVARAAHGGSRSAVSIRSYVTSTPIVVGLISLVIYSAWIMGNTPLTVAVLVKASAAVLPSLDPIYTFRVFGFTFTCERPISVSTPFFIARQ